MDVWVVQWIVACNEKLENRVQIVVKFVIFLYVQIQVKVWIHFLLHPVMGWVVALAFGKIIVIPQELFLQSQNVFWLWMAYKGLINHKKQINQSLNLKQVTKFKTCFGYLRQKAWMETPINIRKNYNI